VRSAVPAEAKPPSNVLLQVVDEYGFFACGFCGLNPTRERITVKRDRPYIARGALSAPS